MVINMGNSKPLVFILLFMVINMGNSKPLVFILLFMILIQTHVTNQLPESQLQAIFDIRRILNYPPSLNKVDKAPDFCSIEPSPVLTIVCFEENITQIHTRGSNSYVPISGNDFTMEALFTAFTALPGLKLLSLVSLGLWGNIPKTIGNLTSLEMINLSSNHLNGSIPVEMLRLENLQTVVLDHNMFSGNVPFWFRSFSGLTVLSLKNNSFSGVLPSSLGMLGNMRILQLSMNNFTGEVPDFSNLTNLQVLDLGHNDFGPSFPSLHNNLVTLVLRKNRFMFGLLDKLSSFYQLQKLDVSENEFISLFTPNFLSLPLIGYLNIAGNKFHGTLLENMTCGNELKFVYLSYNFLTGDLPACLKPGFMSKRRVVDYRGNCLSNGTKIQRQHPFSYCHNEALAVNILSPRKRKRNHRHRSKVVVAMSIVGGSSLVGLLVLGVGLLFSKHAFKKPKTRTILEKAVAMNPSQLFIDAKICQLKKLGPLGLPPYRKYNLDEIKEATSNFNDSTLIGEGSHGSVHKAIFGNNDVAAIRTIKLRKRRGVQAYTHHIELLSKLRHVHLVSALGLCFEYHPEDSTVRKVHLVFEFVSNGTLRDFILRQKPSWPQRIAAAVEVAKGIQFLHTGIGLYSNNIKITDILLDHNLHVKLNSYNLPLLAETKESGDMSSGSKNENNDIYDFGVVLMEIISGREIKSPNDISMVTDLFQVGINADKIARKQVVDPVIHKECCDQSVKIVMEICVRSVSSEANNRPSMDDVLWNLQFSAQVQDSWQGDNPSDRSSPMFTSK